MFPHCRPTNGHHDFTGSFSSQEDAIAFARVHEYNVIVNNNDTNQYYFSHITKVDDHGELKYAFGKNVGNKCDCMYTRRWNHHNEKFEARGLCRDPCRLLTEVDSFFAPVAEGQKGYNSTAWRIDSYKMVTVGV